MTIEAFLATIYTDATARERFVADPQGEARRAGLSEDDVRRMANVDLVGLELAAASFAAKRSGAGCPK